MNLTQTINLTDFKHIRFLGAEGIGMRALIAILEDKISQGELNSDFKISKSDVSKSGEQIITVQLINPNSKEVISEGKGQNTKKAEQDASKNALIKMGYFKN
jgi:hypothetical protein